MIDKEPDVRSDSTPKGKKKGGKAKSKKADKKSKEHLMSTVETTPKPKKNQKTKYNNNRTNTNTKAKVIKPRKPTVKCTISELDGYVFDCTGYQQAEEYKWSKEALESYVVSLTHGTDVQVTLEKGQKMTWTVPDKKSTKQTEQFPDKANVPEQDR